MSVVPNASVDLEMLGDDSWSVEEKAYLVFFGVAVLFQVINVLGLLSDVVRGLAYRCRHGNIWRTQSTKDVGTVSIVVPCFMPNEHGIIEGTLQHLFEELQFEDADESTLEGGRVTVYCVYNAPKAWEHPIEKTLADMDGRSFGPQNRRFKAIRVHGSKSKAENLNHVLPLLQTTHTVIYDADHHPDADSLKIAAAKMQNDDLDCVQGSTYIRAGHGLMGCLIDAEFFFNYFIIFRCLAGVTQTGFFGGSNALWRTEVLQSQLFDDSVQTEDIEYSLRALLRNVRIGFCPEARSGELAPASWGALWRQRKRWALGWDQVTLQHTGPLFRSKDISVCRKVALLWTFILRWVSIVAMLVLACVHPIMVGTAMLHSYLDVADPFDLEMFKHGVPAILMPVSAGAFAVLLLTTVYTLCAVERPTKRFLRQLLFVSVFFICAAVPILLMAALQIVSFYQIYKGTTGGWVVTARAQTKSAPAPAKGHAKLEDDAATTEPSEPGSSSVPEPDPESALEQEQVAVEV